MSIPENIESGSKIIKIPVFLFGPPSDFQESMTHLYSPEYLSFVLQVMYSSMQQFITMATNLLATPSTTHSQSSPVSIPPFPRPITSLPDPLTRAAHPLPSSHSLPLFPSLPPTSIISSQQRLLLSNSTSTGEVHNITILPIFSQVAQQAHRYNPNSPPQTLHYLPLEAKARVQVQKL
jgi:hypothetical protein